MKSLGITYQHLEYVVQHITGTRATLGQVILCEYAQCLTVHLEQVQIELGQIELALAETQKYRNFIATPNPGICV